MSPSRLTVVSGPTAVGKGTVVARLSADHPEIFVSVSATTRPPRPGEINGRHYVLEYPIQADYALIKAERGDRWGNLTYRMTARNFGPIMAAAARITVASVHEVVALGQLDPEAVVTPGLYVQRVVPIARTASKAGGFKKAM